MNLNLAFLEHATRRKRNNEIIIEGLLALEKIDKSSVSKIRNCANEIYNYYNENDCYTKDGRYMKDGEYTKDGQYNRNGQYKIKEYCNDRRCEVCKWQQKNFIFQKIEDNIQLLKERKDYNDFIFGSIYLYKNECQTLEELKASMNELKEDEQIRNLKSSFFDFYYKSDVDILELDLKQNKAYYIPYIHLLFIAIDKENKFSDTYFKNIKKDNTEIELYFLERINGKEEAIESYIDNYLDYVNNQGIISVCWGNILETICEFYNDNPNDWMSKDDILSFKLRNEINESYIKKNSAYLRHIYHWDTKEKEYKRISEEES